MYFTSIKQHCAVIILILMTLTKFGDMRIDQKLEVITRDVCIIGGGASGTFSAIQLHIAGKSDYFNYLEIQWTISTEAPGNTQGITTYFDFDANKIVNNVTTPDIASGLQAYAAQLFQYPYLEEGFFLPDPIPDDLLLPFGDFVEKYKGISGAVSLIFNYGQGLGDFLRQPTLYVFKNFGINVISKDFTEGFIFTKNRDNSEIYNKAYKILKNNVLLQSRVIQVVRSVFHGVEVTVETPSGRKLIKAKKLLVTIPPKLTNLDGFDLDINEKRLFSQFKNTGYYVGLVRNTGIDTNVSVYNINPTEPYGLGKLPGFYRIGLTSIEGLYVFNYGSPYGIPDEYVKGDVNAAIKKLQGKGIAKKTFTDPYLVAYSSHTPFELTVTVEEIKKGFYKKLYALQGQRSTHWTGAAFHTQNSGLLWQFTSKYVLPDLINTL